MRQSDDELPLSCSTTKEEVFHQHSQAVKGILLLPAYLFLKIFSLFSL